MKLKKALALIMTAALTIGTMAGCTQATLNYSKEISNTAKWEATTSDFTGAVNIDAQGVKEEVTFTANAYEANDQSYVDMKFNNTSGNIKIPELKVYVDGSTSYINKSFFEGICAMSGQTKPTGLANITAEYIAIDDATNTSIDVKQIESLTTQPDALVQIGKLVFGENSDIDLPFNQNGREYTINLDANQTVDLAAKAIKAACNNLDNINNTFKLGITNEELGEIKTAVNDASFDAGLTEFKTALAGTTITSKDVFTDTNYTSDCNINLQIKDFGKISIAVKEINTKSEFKAITLPTSKVKLTSEEFANIFDSTNTNIAATTNVITK